jgi:hypothetical protein
MRGAVSAFHPIPPRRHGALAFVVFIGLLALGSTSVGATEIQFTVTRPVDLSPANATAPATLRFSAVATDSCTIAGTCRTRSGIAVQIAPCPPGATSCVGDHAIYFQNRDQVSIFSDMTIELELNVEYTASGEWTLEQWKDLGGGCTQLVCEFSQSFLQTFFIADLVPVQLTTWSAMKTRW